MPVVAVAAVVGAAAAVGGTVIAAKQASKARKLQKQQYAFERQLAQNRSMRERRDAIRAARLATGAAVSNAANQGALDTSASIGGLGSISSQLNSNLSFLDTNQKLSDQAGLAASRANSALSKMQTAQSISQLGMTVFSAAGGFGAFKKSG